MGSTPIASTVTRSTAHEINSHLINSGFNVNNEAVFFPKMAIVQVNILEAKIQGSIFQQHESASAVVCLAEERKSWGRPVWLYFMAWMVKTW